MKYIVLIFTLLFSINSFAEYRVILSNQKINLPYSEKSVEPEINTMIDYEVPITLANKKRIIGITSKDGVIYGVSNEASIDYVHIFNDVTKNGDYSSNTFYNTSGNDNPLSIFFVNELIGEYHYSTKKIILRDLNTKSIVKEISINYPSNYLGIYYHNGYYIIFDRINKVYNFLDAETLIFDESKKFTYKGNNNSPFGITVINGNLYTISASEAKVEKHNGLTNEIVESYDFSDELNLVYGITLMDGKFYISGLKHNETKYKIFALKVF